MAVKTGKRDQTGQNFDHDWIYMLREKIVFVSDDLFSSRSTLLVLGKLKGQKKNRRCKQHNEEKQACLM